MAPFYLPADPKLTSRAGALAYAAKVRRTLGSQYRRAREGWLIQSDVFVAYRESFRRVIRAAGDFPAPRLPG